jgi:uncharacterized protein (DUF4213/DUF364 family)
MGGCCATNTTDSKQSLTVQTILPKGILAETIAAVTDILGAELDGITVERAVIGLFYTGVALSCGTADGCATPRDAMPDAMCCPMTMQGAPYYGPLQGKTAAALIGDVQAADGIRRSLAIATLNALAEECWGRRPHPLVELRAGIDAFDAVKLAPDNQVVVVGAFIPFLKRLKSRGQPYLVLEQEPGTLKPEEMPFYRPAEMAREVVPLADVLLITGTTLLNDTLEDLLALARPDTKVTIVGPSVTLLPGPFLDRGADVLGGVRITKPDEFLAILGEGGGAPHFLGRAAEKIVLARRSASAAKAA